MKTITLFVVLFFSVVTFSQEKIEEVKIENQKRGIQKLSKSITTTSVVSSKELLKAACCNLAESFETNPAIDVNFADALTGTKQIKMLGLTSPYLLFTEENIPSVRGASQAYGLSFTPGTWVESIQITKGASSVTNGYESISGQINTELLKPMKDLPFFLNIYGSSDARFEINTHFNKQISKYWATSLFVHGNTRIAKMDVNNDGFLDNPLTTQINVMSRWQYSNPDTGWVSFINFKSMKDEKQTGQLVFNPKTDRLTTTAWGSEINTTRFEFSSKVGYVFKELPFQSIGFQNAFTNHDQQSYFGLNQYNITQQSLYSNLIFNSIINNTNHKFSTGLSFTYDKYAEFVTTNDVSRTDNSVGAFFEYTNNQNDKFSFILGGRIDYHNRIGVFFTPRLHAKYIPWQKAIFRFSAGRGKRLANIYAENQQLFASSRIFSILNSDGKTYGLQPEIAWNYGISFTQNFNLFGKKADAGFDYYRTDFQNQVVVDVFKSPQHVLFYNLSGKSFANSLQVDLNIEVIKQLNLRTAYKFYDIATDYISGNFQRPMQAKQRFFTNLEYETPKNKDAFWKFDTTLNWLGQQQLPTTNSNPYSDQLPQFSNPFTILNAQITRLCSKNFEIYIGGENITNYTQKKAILGNQNPFGTTFDASITYAPVFGQMYYAGLRFKIK